MNRYLEQLLFPVLFHQQTFEAISATRLYQKLANDKVFLEALHDAVVKMHVSYSGSHANLLRTFFVEANLAEISLKKLSKGAWNEKCSAIRDLSQMHIDSSSDFLLEYCNASNETLRNEAIIGLVRLKGFEGLAVLQEFTFDVNPWMIINIIHQLNLQNQTIVPSFDFLLQSKNSSVIMLGCRLVEYYKQVENLKLLLELHETTSHPGLKELTTLIIEKLKSY